MNDTVVDENPVATADDLATGIVASSNPTDAVAVMTDEVPEQENRTPPSVVAEGVPAAAAAVAAEAAGATTGEPLTETTGEVLVTPSHEPATGDAAAAAQTAAAPTVEKPLVVSLEDLSSSVGFDKEVPGPAEGEPLPEAAAEASTVAAPVVDLGGGPPVAGGVPAAVSFAASEMVEPVADEPAHAQDTSEPEKPASTAELEGLPEEVAHAAHHVDVAAAGMAGSSECGSVAADQDDAEVVVESAATPTPTPTTEVVEVDSCEDGRAVGQEGSITADVGEPSEEAPPTSITTPEETTENTSVVTPVDGTPAAAGEGQPFAAIVPTIADEGVSGTVETEQVASADDEEATTGKREAEHPAPGASEATEASVADVEVASPGSLEDEVGSSAVSSCGQRVVTLVGVGLLSKLRDGSRHYVAVTVPPSTTSILFVQRLYPDKTCAT